MSHPTTTPPDSALPPAPPHSRSSSTKKRVPREVRFGAYVLGSTLGEGEFGKVKLGWRKDGKQPSQAAIKLIRRDSIPRGSDKESKIHREINALKKLSHPNIVKLEEVLQNEKYIGIVLEYASGGELFDYILEHKYLKESMASRLFAQLVSGVDYMHSKGIIHRDLKLENLLLDKHKNIVITDFGFANSFSSHDLMRTSCGSPCYAAPELVVSSDPYEARKVDVWSCGVILYAMLAGYLPFDDDPLNPDGDNIARLYHYITHTPLTFPEYIQPTPRDLLRRILVSNPKRRINLKQVRSHPWLAPHAPFLSVTPNEWDMNYKSSSALPLVSQADKASRRLSLMENPTSASFMFNRPSVKSYSTHNVSALLYSNPAAPQTSHAVAVPSSSSTTSVKDIGTPSGRRSPVTSSSIETGRSNHKRSDSSASLAALQAVVEADNVEQSRRYSVPVELPSATASSATPRTIPNFIPHSSSLLASSESITSSSSPVGKGFETIVESPEKNKTDMLPPLMPAFTKPSASASSSASVSKLPTRVNRQRPTSYHPASASSAYQFPSPDLTFLMPLNTSDSSLSAARPRYDRTNSFKIPSASSSPNRENRNSWGQPKIIEPTLDMSMANGVLTRSIHDDRESSNKTPVSEKRKSAAFDSLSNAIDLLSINSSKSAAVNGNVGTSASSQIITDSQSALEKETVTSISPTPPTDNTSPSVNIAEQETVAGSTTNVTEIIEKHPHQQVTIPIVPKPEPKFENKHLSAIKPSTSEKENIVTRSTSTSRKPARVSSKSSEKENRSSSISPTASSNNPPPKFKRFSMLSFYHSSSAIPSPTDSQHPEPTSSSNHVRKPLENSNRRINSQSVHLKDTSAVLSDVKAPSPPSSSGHRNSNAYKRMSMPASSTTNNNKPKEREGSAAKRVMDFFKRRSIRI